MVKDMTEGKPYKLLLSFCIPLMFGSLFQQMYNMVDAIIVGRFLGKEALAAVGSTGAIHFLIIGFVNGMCCGFAIPVAQHFGAKDYVSMRKSVANMLWISLVFGALFTFFTVAFTRQILTLMQTPENIFQDAYAYIVTLFAGIFATLFYNLLAGIIRALGDSKTPLVFLMIASFLNIFLDLLFIVIFHFGVFGAALATVVSQLISVILCLIFIIKKYSIIHPKKDEWHWNSSSIKELIVMGIPMGLQYSLTAIGSTVLQSAVNTLGSDVVASLTAAGKVHSLVCQPMESLGVTMATYTGQNLGAKQYDRIRIGVRQGMFICILFAIMAFTIVSLWGGTISQLFIDSTETDLIANIEYYLFRNGIFFILLASLLVLRNTLQGMGYAPLAMSAGDMEMIARSVVAIGFIPTLGFNAVCFANPAAWLGANIFLVPAYFYTYKHLQHRRSIHN